MFLYYFFDYAFQLSTVELSVYEIFVNWSSPIYVLNRLLRLLFHCKVWSVNWLGTGICKDWCRYLTFDLKSGLPSKFPVSSDLKFFLQGLCNILGYFVQKQSHWHAIVIQYIHLGRSFVAIAIRSTQSHRTCILVTSKPCLLSVGLFHYLLLLIFSWSSTNIDNLSKYYIRVFAFNKLLSFLSTFF